jgi:hypothetical protein
MHRKGIAAPAIIRISDESAGASKPVAHAVRKGIASDGIALEVDVRTRYDHGPSSFQVFAGGNPHSFKSEESRVKIRAAFVESPETSDRMLTLTPCASNGQIPQSHSYNNPCDLKR